MRAVSPLVGALIALFGCSGPADHGGFGEAPREVPPPSPSATTEQKPEEALDAVRVLAPGGSRYDPTSVEIRTGRPTQLVFSNTDSQEHTLVASELAIAMLAGPGQTVRSTVNLSPSSAGRVAYFCTVPGHRAAGMEGVIRVLRA